MAKNESSNESDQAPQDESTLTDESLEQIVGGNQSSHGQGKGKGKDSSNNLNNLKQIGLNDSFGDGSVRSISDGTSNTINLGEA